MRQYKTILGLLRNPEHWTRGVAARTKRHGKECEVSEGSAFCLLGASKRVYGQDELKENKADNRIKDAINRLYPQIVVEDAGDIANFNDNRYISHADVLRVLKLAGV